MLLSKELRKVKVQLELILEILIIMQVLFFLQKISEIQYCEEFFVDSVYNRI